MRGYRYPAAQRKVQDAVGFAVFSFACLVPVVRLAAQDLPSDLAELSIEQLMDLEVTSVAKQAQKQVEAAAAVYVITHDDIRRSGLTSIPAALRLAPGVHVARIDAGKWAISVRGFTGRYANKLLVLVDGRTIYSPFFSGVRWELQDVPLDDVARSEVVHRFGMGERHRFIWGAGYRFSADRVDGTSILDVAPRARDDQLVNVFVQDEICLLAERLRLSLGTKVEHNDYTGVEFEPSLRLTWLPNDNQTVWAAVSRAVRVPSRMEHDGRINVAAFPGGPGVTNVLTWLGNDGLDAENLVAYECGYRILPTERLSIACRARGLPRMCGWIFAWPGDRGGIWRCRSSGRTCWTDATRSLSAKVTRRCRRKWSAACTVESHGISDTA